MIFDLSTRSAVQASEMAPFFNLPLYFVEQKRKHACSQHVYMKNVLNYQNKLPSNKNWIFLAETVHSTRSSETNHFPSWFSFSFDLVAYWRLNAEPQIDVQSHRWSCVPFQYSLRTKNTSPFLSDFTSVCVWLVCLDLFVFFLCLFGFS